MDTINCVGRCRINAAFRIQAERRIYAAATWDFAAPPEIFNRPHTL
jgi:hypothetical protein